MPSTVNAENKRHAIQMLRAPPWNVTTDCAQPTSFIISLPSIC